ncbi:MAG: AAA family ATPase [Bacteroidota bacterium]
MYTEKIKHYLGFEPTSDQNTLIENLSQFLISQECDVCIINGYAGTGKTSVMSSLVKCFDDYEHNYVLLAPTGRAAKVLSNYSGRKAQTIHRKIYKMVVDKSGGARFALQKNTHFDTVFIIDEASMLSDKSNEGGFEISGSGVFNDLLEYVFSSKRCKLILVGDNAQLPPVKLDYSPALDIDYVKSSVHTGVILCSLKDVVRQSLDSGILYNATLIRKNLITGEDLILDVADYPDIIWLTGADLEDKLNYVYSNYGAENTLIVCRSNKRANIYNREIRNRILYRESELAAGDMMMVVKNNYFWLDEKSDAGFIANGDALEILRVKKYEDLYGFHFADATVRLLDYPEQAPLEVKLLLDTVTQETPSLPYEDNKRLFNTVLEDYQDETSWKKKMEKMRTNPYLNSLQVKFSYAVTCHKAQGGQWEQVFIDHGYLTEEMIGPDFYRWLYTAITRATDKVYLVNFDKRFALEK